MTVISVRDLKGFLALELRTKFGDHLVQRGGYREELKAEGVETRARLIGATRQTAYLIPSPWFL